MGITRKLNRAEKKKAQDFEKRWQSFHNDYKVISQKHKVDLKAGLDFRNDAILPSMRPVDLKAIEEEQAKITAKAETEKNKREAKQKKAIKEMKRDES